MARNLEEPGANFNQLLELSLNLENARTFAGTKVADASTEMEQSPDSFLRPGETLEDWDTTFRKPSAAGGRVGYQEGKIVLPQAKPKEAVLKNKMEDFERSVNLAVMGIRGGIDKDIMVDMLQKKQNEIGVSNTDAKNIIQNFMQRLSRGLKSKGGRVGLVTGSGDYAKKYLKYGDKPTQDKFNRLVNDLRTNMSLESAISEALREIRAGSN